MSCVLQYHADKLDKIIDVDVDIQATGNINYPVELFTFGCLFQHCDRTWDDAAQRCAERVHANALTQPDQTQLIVYPIAHLVRQVDDRGCAARIAALFELIGDRTEHGERNFKPVRKIRRT